MEIFLIITKKSGNFSKHEGCSLTYNGLDKAGKKCLERNKQFL